MARHYATASGNDSGGAGGEWDRRFVVVAGPSRAFLERCPREVFDPKSDMFLTTTPKGQNEPPPYQVSLALRRKEIPRESRAVEHRFRSPGYALH
jgi:hypothetical protein